jgi:RsiW-degrading membrane proteinase PrsW (M82 family)
VPRQTARAVRAFALVALVLFIDRYEPEPLRMIALTFFWGATIAAFNAIVINTVGEAIVSSQHGTETAELYGYSISAPIVEESAKGLVLFGIYRFYRREFNGVVDGIVYAALVGLGFAMTENVLYYGRGAAEEGIVGAVGTFVVRGLLSPFAHPVFTAMTGIGLGIAARSADRWVRVCAPLAGLLVAMMLHGTWNLVPTLAASTGEGLILLYGYIALMVPVFFGVLGLTIWLRGWEGRLTERALPIYVRAGWLSPPEVAALGSLARRHSARQWARRVAGPQGLQAMRAFQFAATRLALLRDGLQRGLDSRPADRARAERDEQRLLAEIATYRQVFVGRDPQVPPAVWDGEHYRVVFPDGVQRPLPAPEEPVVPIPVVLAPPVPYYGYPYR